MKESDEGLEVKPEITGVPDADGYVALDAESELATDGSGAFNILFIESEVRQASCNGYHEVDAQTRPIADNKGLLLDLGDGLIECAAATGADINVPRVGVVHMPAGSMARIVRSSRLGVAKLTSFRGQLLFTPDETVFGTGFTLAIRPNEELSVDFVSGTGPLQKLQPQWEELNQFWRLEEILVNGTSAVEFQKSIGTSVFVTRVDTVRNSAGEHTLTSLTFAVLDDHGLPVGNLSRADEVPIQQAAKDGFYVSNPASPIFVPKSVTLPEIDLRFELSSAPAPPTRPPQPPPAVSPFDSEMYIRPLEHMTPVFDTLVDIKSSSVLVPGLAEWKFLTESSALELTLRRGVEFHDGTPLTGAVVKEILDSDAELYPGVVRRSLVTSGLIDHIESIDGEEYTLRLILPSEPGFPSLLHAEEVLATLSGMSGAMSSPNTSSGEYAGTGPFEYVGPISDGRLQLQPFARYLGPSTSVRGIDLAVESGDDDRLSALQDGDVDAIIGDDRTTFETLAESPDLFTVCGDKTRFLAITGTLEGFGCHPDGRIDLGWTQGLEELRILVPSLSE